MRLSIRRLKNWKQLKKFSLRQFWTKTKAIQNWKQKNIKQQKKQRIQNIMNNNKPKHERQLTSPIVKVIRFRPTNFEKYAVIIANHLLNQKPVLIDYSKLSPTSRQRLIDFISGVVYCLGGLIEKKGPSSYLAMPTKFSFDDSRKDEEDE